MNKHLSSILVWVKKNKWLLSLIAFYFVFRLINLTKLPIFNDESIYLDWGWREIHRSGNLYYSLYDAKQPFLMWIFGFFESIFSDPLFAGRLVSVVTGFLSLIGIYKLAKYLFEGKIALISAFLYTLTPIFSFYDRQALMESAVAMVGIWACYFILKSIKEKSLKYPILTGLVLGIGFFIKSSSLIFIVSYALLVLFYTIVFKKFKMISNFLATVIIFLATSSLLLINPQFWDTIGSNSRYTLTINELLSLPFDKWLQSIMANLQIGFYGLTPLLFLIGLVGIIMIFLKKDFLKKAFVIFFLLAFLITTFLVRIPTDRYLVSFLPFLVIPASYFIFFCFTKNKIFGIMLYLFVLVIPFCLTTFQVIAPTNYLLATEKIPYFGNSGYLSDSTSGYAVNQAINYFKAVSKHTKIIITVANNTGNPESAIITYFNNTPNVQVVYMDGRIFGPMINEYDCLSSSVPLYFVSREEQLVGLDKYLLKLKTIKNPHGQNTIGIYVLKKNCSGKTFELRPEAT